MSSASDTGLGRLTKQLGYEFTDKSLSCAWRSLIAVQARIITSGSNFLVIRYSDSSSRKCCTRSDANRQREILADSGLVW